MLHKKQHSHGKIRDWITNLATCGPLGSWGPAPGTNGALLGWAGFIVLHYSLAWQPGPIELGLLALAAVIICGIAERRLGQRDPSQVILDEVVAMPICFLGLDPLHLYTSQAWLVLLAGLTLFRFFDVVKPWPIHYLQSLPGGWGIVIDDLGAALATAFTLHIAYLAASYLF